MPASRTAPRRRALPAAAGSAVPGATAGGACGRGKRGRGKRGRGSGRAGEDRVVGPLPPQGTESRGAGRPSEAPSPEGCGQSRGCVQKNLERSVVAARPRRGAKARLGKERGWRGSTQARGGLYGASRCGAALHPPRAGQGRAGARRPTGRNCPRPLGAESARPQGARPYLIPRGCSPRSHHFPSTHGPPRAASKPWRPDTRRRAGLAKK